MTPMYETLYELPQNGSRLLVNVRNEVPEHRVLQPVRLCVLAEDGIVDYVFDLSFDQALSVAEAVLHGARMRAL